MLQLKNISYQFAGKPLLTEINWTIHTNKQMALIGANGAGKTTLLRIIKGILPIQEGEIQKPKGYRIGYLPQEEILIGRGTVLSEAMLADHKVQDLERKINDLHQQLDDQDLSPERQNVLTGRLGMLEEQFSIFGGYDYEARAKKILMGLGFKESEFSDPVNKKSGGWRMRIYLVRLLLQNPDLLLLDEPTNHLDITSLEWLENYLTDFLGSIIIVTHDRFFIDRLADEIAELENMHLIHYPGKYAYFEQNKALRLEQLRQKSEEINAERARLTQFINRFRYKATKAVQVQDRVKKLQKLDTIELPKVTPKINFKIVCPEKSYKDVCLIRDLSFRYTNQWVFKEINLNLYRGEKVAIVGANGEGKTTLTRLISGQLAPQKGNLTIGQRVEIGYYAQHQIDNLNPDNTAYEEVETIAAEIYRTRIRDILGIFKLSGDDINKKISVLSGGEKARVSLAKILLSPVNFLLMDEPTNHLDLYSKKALEKALLNYDGTLLLISHDRYFLDKLVTIVFELKNGKLRRFEGNYSDYLNKRATKEQVYDESEYEPEKKTVGHRDKEQKRLEAEARQNISNRRRVLNEEIAALELKMEDLEDEKKVIELKMADPTFYKNQLEAAGAGKRYQELQELIPQLYKEWENKQTEIEALLSDLNSQLKEINNNIS